MTVRIYRSSDFGAPNTLNNAAGAFITVLDACLVNGYGDQTITITSAGGLATVTTPSPHGLIKTAKYTVSGANEAAYNGEHSVTVVDGVTLTFPVAGTPATPATGTITGRLSGSGWTKPFSGTYLASYLQGAGSNGMSLRVDDTGTMTRLVGYETMSDVNTGTQSFPTNAQMAGGAYQSKSTNTTYRDWVLLADEKRFYFSSNADGSAGDVNGQGMFFGDINSYLPGDSYSTMLAAGNTSSANSSSKFYNLVESFGTNTAHYMARAYTQLGGSIQCGKMVNGSKGVATGMGYAGYPFPDPITNALHYDKVEVTEPSPTSSIRGYLPGLWNPLHARPLVDGDYFEDGAGKIFLVVTQYYGQLFLEISDTWV